MHSRHSRTGGTIGTRDSINSDAPLLSSQQINYHTTNQEQNNRQSSRTRGAERFRSTPDGEFMNSKREGFKKLFKNPKQFFREAIGAGYEEMAQKNAGEEKRRASQERQSHQNHRHDRSHIQIRNDYSHEPTSTQRPPVREPLIASEFGRGAEYVYQLTRRAGQITPIILPDPPLLVRPQPVTSRSPPPPTVPTFSVASPAPTPPRPVTPLRLATPFRPLTTSPRNLALAPSVAHEPQRPPPPSAVLRSNATKANQPIIPKALPMPPVKPTPAQTPNLNAVPPSPPFASTPPKSAMKSQASNEINESRPQQNVMFRPVLVQVRTFRKDDEPKNLTG